MNFLNRIFNKAKQKSVSILGGAMRSAGFESYFDALNLRSFKDSLYLFIGVSMIRDTVASLPIEVYKVKSAEGDHEEVESGELVDLLERPNSMQTKMEFWKLAVSYYLLAGETFWYLERDDVRQFPTAMANMRPDSVEVLLSADKLDIVGYKFYQDNGQALMLRVDQVLHIKNIDPTNPLRGVGVVHPATTRILTEKEASRHQALTFKAQGRPDIAIFTTKDLTQESAEDARKRWAKVYGEDSGSTKAGFFGQDIKDLKVISTSPREMDFMGTQAFLRDDILAALRIPKAMVTSDDVNLANSKTARINYIKEACLPVRDAFDDAINGKLLRDVDSEEFVAYESPVNEDRELLLKESVELKKNGIISTNEARSLMNYSAVEGGDAISVTTSPIEVAMKNIRLRKIAKTILKKRPIMGKRFKAIEAVQKMLDAEKHLKAVKRGRSSIFTTKEAKEGYAKAFNADIDKKADGFKDHVDVYNRGLEVRIVQHMTKFGISVDSMFDVAQEMRIAGDIFKPLMRDMYKAHGQSVMNNVASGFAQKAAEQFFTLEAILEQLDQRSEFFIASMLNTDFDQLKEVVAEGLKEGLGIDAIARKIRGYFDDMSVSRAKTIARTETGRLISMATNDAYGQSALVTGKEWLTSEDSKVRDNAGTVDDHVINAGVIVGKEDRFPNGEMFPGELTINCRCAIAPAV